MSSKLGVALPATATSRSPGCSPAASAALPCCKSVRREIGEKVIALFSEPVYEKRIAGYQALNKEAVEAGATIPLLQSVQTLVRKKNLDYVKYGNGWVLGNKMSWS